MVEPGGAGPSLDAREMRSMREKAMPEYRFYRTDRQGRRYGPPEVADCAGDDEAVEHARRILTGFVIEVCQADRTVKRVEPPISGFGGTLNLLNKTDPSNNVTSS